MNTIFRSSLRALASIAFFGASGPILATVAFYLAVVLWPGNSNPPFPLREVLGAYLELGVVALACGAAFVVVVLVWAIARRAATRLSLVVAGGLSVLVVLSPYLGPLLTGQAKPNAGLVVLLGACVGLTQGLAIPKALVPFIHRPTHGA
jgi:hypothetical protein